MPSSLHSARTRPHSGGVGGRRAASPAAPAGVALAPWLALLALAALALVYVVSRGTGVGDRVDVAGLLRGFDGDALPRAHEATLALVETVDRGALAVAGLLVVAIAAVRRRWALGATALAAIAAANVSTQVLKPVLGELDLVSGDAGRLLTASFPSGHATVAMSVVLGVVLVAPAAYRPVAALIGAGYAAAMGVALIALAWHYPSDVVGGYLVAGFWASAGAALALRRGMDGPGEAPVRATSVAGGAVLLTCGGILAMAIAGAVVALERPGLLVVGALQTTFVVASMLTAVLAIVIAAVFAGILARVPGVPGA